jgi:RNA polymerase sigma-70 factor (ECF subfamily)
VKNVKEAAQADFEAIFARYWSRVYGLLFRLVGEHAEAEDLALEVFWRYYQRPPGEHDPDTLGGWLYRVALRMGYNALRSQRRRRNYEELAVQQDWQDNHRRVAESQVEETLQRQQVRQALVHMKPRAAQLLVLRYAGCSYAEIAATLQILPGSVGSLLARAEVEFQKRYERVERGG